MTYCSDSDRQSFGPPGTQNCSGGPVKNVYGSVCVHQCPTGYILQGNASVSCQSNGQWDHDFPSCQGMELLLLKALCVSGLLVSVSVALV